MAQQGASGMHVSSSRPTAAAVASPPAAAAAAAGGGVMTVGSVAIVVGTIMIFVFIAATLVSLQYVFDAWEDRERERDGAWGARRRRGGGAAGGGGGVRARRGGVDPDILRSLPVTVYRAAAPGSKEAVECAVCLAELEDGEEARFLPRCGHGFHAGCVDTWLASHTTCPLCRLAVVAKPGAPPAPSWALRPVPPEPANYAGNTNLPASVLVGVSDADRRAVAVASDGDTSTSMAVLVIEIPDEVAVPGPTPRDDAKSPVSARLRSLRRLWSFGRQGAGPSSSCSCAGAGGEGADVEQGISVTTGMAVTSVTEAQLTSGAAAGATQGSAV